MSFLSRLFGGGDASSSERPPDPPDPSSTLPSPQSADTSHCSPTAKNIHDAVLKMCAEPGRSFQKDKHAQRLLPHVAASSVPRDIADLFVEATTLTAAFTGARTTESLQAVQKLCEKPGPIVDNLLLAIAGMKDTQQTTSVLDARGPKVEETASRTEAVSFEAQRAAARAELAQRASPVYDAKYYHDVSERLIEIERLGDSRQTAAVPRLIDLYRAGDGKEKRAALHALGTIRDSASAAALHEIFTSEADVKARRAAARGFVTCKIGDGDAGRYTPTMIAALADRDGSVREAALEWVKAHAGTARASAAAPVDDVRHKLGAMLQDQDPNVVYHAADALAEIGSGGEIAALEECARRVKPAAVPRVKEAIKRLKERLPRIG